MTPDRYLEVFRTEGAALDAAARTVDLEAHPVGCPDWTARRLVEHCGQVWTMVHASLSAGEAVVAASGDVPVDTDDVLAWQRDAHRTLLGYLSERDPGDTAWTRWAHRDTLGFWYRRMAHEASLHRWDLESVGDDPRPIPADVAVDGIDELLDHYVGDRRPDAFAGDSGTVHLHATDAEGEWLLTRTPAGLEIERTHAKGDVAARGPASDLLLMMWNRLSPDTESIEVFGDGDLLHAWQREVRF